MIIRIVPSLNIIHESFDQIGFDDGRQLKQEVKFFDQVVAKSCGGVEFVGFDYVA